VRGWVKKGRVGMKMEGDRGVEENAKVESEERRERRVGERRGSRAVDKAVNREDKRSRR
jgi:hypothetical protein